MNIDRIKEIVNQELLPDNAKEMLIIDVLSCDENVIPVMMKILEAERIQKKELLRDTNALLGKADVGLDNPKLFNKDNFIQAEIAEHYQKYKSTIGHCFKNYDINTNQNDQSKSTTTHRPLEQGGL